MKKFLLFFLILFIALPVFSDETNKDLSSEKNSEKFRDKSDYFMKFRGSVGFGLMYKFDRHRGISNGNHIGNINYNPIDYTDSEDPLHLNHSVGDPGSVLGNAFGKFEAFLFYSYSFTAPFLTADNPLMNNNNITITFDGDVSPISVNGGMKFSFTPVAFLNFSAGFSVGTGWHLTDIGDGIALNDAGEMLPLISAVMRIYFTTTLQFDVGVVVPKAYSRWAHIVMGFTPKIQYLALPSISDDTPFLFLDDYGENYNGWKFYGDFFVGYQLPIIQEDTGQNDQFLKIRHNNFVITLGMSLSVDYLDLSHFYDSPMAENGWGSDFCYMRFGPLVAFDLPNNFFVSVLFNWHNDKAYSDRTVGNLDFRTKEYQDWYVYFERIAIFSGWSF